jgi:hypothetical protein
MHPLETYLRELTEILMEQTLSANYQTVKGACYPWPQR